MSMKSNSFYLYTPSNHTGFYSLKPLLKTAEWGLTKDFKAKLRKDEKFFTISICDAAVTPMREA